MSLKNQIVIIITSGNSGGGAIHDFLLSRFDFTSPFQGEEFRLISDPYGIENLYNNFINNFSLNNSSEAFHQFKKYSKNLENLKSSKTNKLIYGKKFKQLTLKYLNKIESLSYRGIPQFQSVDLSYLNKFSFKFKKKFFGYKNHNHDFYTMRLPVSEKKFIYETSKYLTDIFKSNIKSIYKKNIILDQATNFWKPEIIFKYFKNAKIIVVTRDPRSIYYSMKFRGSYAYPGYDLKIFVNWYKNIMHKRSKVIKKYKNKLLELRFEEFTKNTNKEIKKINKFLNLKNVNTKNFDYEFSKNNAYKAKNSLSNYELNFIEKNLKNYLQW